MSWFERFSRSAYGTTLAMRREVTEVDERLTARLDELAARVAELERGSQGAGSSGAGSSEAGPDDPGPPQR